MWKKTLLGLLTLLIAIQFIRQSKNLGSSSGANDIQVSRQPSPEIGRLLQTACYDCHSNHTRYPWYAEVEPIGWWLASHIKDGKRHVNFSEFATLTPKRAANRLKDCADEVTQRDMPLFSYTLIHTDARLTPAQRKLLADWFNAERAKIPVEAQ